MFVFTHTSFIHRPIYIFLFFPVFLLLIALDHKSKSILPLDEKTITVERDVEED